MRVGFSISGCPRIGPFVENCVRTWMTAVRSSSQSAVEVTYMCFLFQGPELY